MKMRAVDNAKRIKCQMNGGTSEDGIKRIKRWILKMQMKNDIEGLKA